VIPFDEHDECMQGLLGIKDATHLKDTLGVALKMIEILCAENKAALESLYNITIEGQDTYGIVELIGQKSNFLKKKGEIDEMRVARKVIDDWQKGLLVA